MKPVSVIIPTFNRVKYLQRAIYSVLQQENFQGEIIVADDGSQDETAEIVENLMKHFPIIYSFADNRGPAAARNRGVALANFDTIAFLDSDDHWRPRKLARQLEAMEKSSHFVISHTCEKWLRRGKHLNQKKIHKPQHGNIFHYCLPLCAVGMSTVIMQKDIFFSFGGFDTDLPCCEDYEFWLRVSSKHDFLLVNDDLTIKEGGREDQLSYKYRMGMDKFRIYALEKLLSAGTLTAAQVDRTLVELKRKCRIYGNGCIKHGREDEGHRYLSIPDKYKAIETYAKE
ncbi:MAG: glycosyltransferase family A protein [Desulfopila sp.]|jgi:glycosyltransferase involved in cell wall biosynthesis|nr:glycosyltransferase family A protein [Desulfopila sp.]